VACWRACWRASLRIPVHAHRAEWEHRGPHIVRGMLLLDSSDSRSVGTPWPSRSGPRRPSQQRGAMLILTPA